MYGRPARLSSGFLKCLVREVPEGFDLPGWKIAPASIDILAVAEDVQVAVEKPLPAAHAIQRLVEGVAVALGQGQGGEIGGQWDQLLVELGWVEGTQLH